MTKNVAMSKGEVGRYLDNLLVELEVTKDDKVEKEFVEAYNYYHKVYDLRGYAKKLPKIHLW